MHTHTHRRKSDERKAIIFNANIPTKIPSFIYRKNSTLICYLIIAKSERKKYTRVCVPNGNNYFLIITAERYRRRKHHQSIFLEYKFIRNEFFFALTESKSPLSESDNVSPSIGWFLRFPITFSSFADCLCSSLRRQNGAQEPFSLAENSLLKIN